MKLLPGMTANLAFQVEQARRRPADSQRPLALPSEGRIRYVRKTARSWRARTTRSRPRAGQVGAAEALTVPASTADRSKARKYVWVLDRRAWPRSKSSPA